MQRRFAALIALALAAAPAACLHKADAPARFSEMHDTTDWQYGAGDAMAAAMQDDVTRLAKAAGRDGAIAELTSAGYACTYGEAHEDYPEPAAVCAKSFATRACQLDWEVVLTSDPARPGEVETADSAFRRDCLGVERDWPEPVKSAIDDQVAPGPEVPPGQP